MNSIDRLKEDHDRVTSKIPILESAFAMGEEAWFVIREVCFSVSTQLHTHIKHEEQLVVACRSVLGQLSLEELNRFDVTHHKEHRRLQIINWLLKGDPCFSLDGIRSTCATAITTLHHHIEQQEAELFPLLERVLGPYEIVWRDWLRAATRLTGTMTVQEVLRRYPQTKAVFERFSVDGVLERYETLEEVAWCHGVESRRLLAHLEKASACPRWGDNPTGLHAGSVVKGTGASTPSETERFDRARGSYMTHL